jgi:hypothetical protein
MYLEEKRQTRAPESAGCRRAGCLRHWNERVAPWRKKDIPQYKTNKIFQSEKRPYGDQYVRQYEAHDIVDRLFDQ